MLGGVLGGAVELVEEGGADGHGPWASGSSAVCPSAGPGRSSPGSRGNIML